MSTAVAATLVQAFDSSRARVHQPAIFLPNTQQHLPVTPTLELLYFVFKEKNPRKKKFQFSKGQNSHSSSFLRTVCKSFIPVFSFLFFFSRYFFVLAELCLCPFSVLLFTFSKPSLCQELLALKKL
ncbi:hypothetical protein Pfo_010688, partial [Paulownia fortunei]